MEDSGKELTYSAFINREFSFRHSPFEKEFAFYHYVKKGDIENVKQHLTPLGEEGSGILSENPIQNLKYHFVITMALLTRFCVEEGMELEIAYTLSDLYIIKADKCVSETEIQTLHKKAVWEFTERMYRLSKEHIYSKPVTMVMDYIYDHLHSKISVEELAEYVSLSTPYLSRLFHRETGKTVTAYITDKRIEAAENLLKYSDYSPADIANYLAFSSHSHFISTFRKCTGMTPREYRKHYYRTISI